MRRVYLTRALKGLLWILVLLAGFSMFSQAVERFLTSDGAGQSIDRAVMELPDGTRHEVTLPIQWTPQDGQVTTRAFEIDLVLDAVPDEGLFLYLPYFEQRLQVLLRDDMLFDSRIAGRWNPLDRLTSMVFLPPNDLRPGSNTVRLSVEAGPAPLGSLSPVIFGSLDQLRGVYHVRGFLKDSIKQVLFGVQAVLACIGLLLFALRPSDQTFGWLGLTMTFASLIALGTITTGIPLVDALQNRVYILAPLAGVALFGFALSLAELRLSWVVLTALITVAVVLLFVRESLGVAGPQIGFFFSLPFFVLCVLASIAVLTVVSIRDPRPEHVLFLFGLVLLVAGTAHDFAIRLYMSSDALFVALFSRFFSVTAITILIVRRLVDQARSLDEAAITLRGRLREKEKELAAAFERQQMLDGERILSEERARITADLHDGVAGHLATIVALSDRPDDTTPDIKRTARNALVDLRMVIDAMAFRGGSLRYYLGLFRNRCVEPIENLGIVVNWSMTRLPEIEHLSQEQALNIMRILQEAVSNAVRHGNPEQITITGAPEGTDRIRLTVTNSGGAPVQAVDSGGMGLVNMRRRAHALGGSVDFIKTNTGATLTLSLPLAQVT